MRSWILLLGGLLVWFVHLMGVYGIVSFADVVGRPDSVSARAAVGGLTVLAAGGDAVLIWLALRGATDPQGPAPAELTRFWRSMAAGGAAFSLLAVLWQGLPAIVGH